MPFINGKKLSEHLDKFQLAKQKQICKKISQSIAKLHNENIIHGDLTTSNMILVENKTENFNKLLSRLKKLNLPIKEYSVFGSGPLIIRGIRDSHDIDVIISKKIFNEYKKKPGWILKEFDRDTRHIKMLENKGIEFYYTWGPGEWDIEKVLEKAEIIGGIPFANLNDFKRWKKISGREKDKKDLELIKNFSFNKSQTNRASAQIIFFIDFGLGFISTKIEDKAVDLHLLKQALEAKHFKNWEILWKEIEKNYKFADAKKILERLKAVEKRGRYKH